MMTKKKSIKSQLIMICMSIVIFAAAVLTIVAIVCINSQSSMTSEEYNKAKDSGYETEIKSEVQTVIAVLKSENDKVTAGKMSEDEAKAEAKEIVRNMRYRDDDSGYFWIDDTDYILIMHPILTDKEGSNRKDLTDKNGVKIVQTEMKVVSGPDKGGFSEFYFTKADGVTVAPKKSYSAIFEPWGWVVSTGNYVDDMEVDKANVLAQIASSRVKMLTVICVLVTIMMIAVFFVAKRYGKKITNPLIKIQNMATHLADGDLTYKVEVHDDTEIGRTADALNKAQAEFALLISAIGGISSHLSDAVKEFAESFETMGDNIKNVSSAVNEIASNNTTQAQSTEKASDSVANISTGIGSTTKEVKSLEDNANTMKDYSDKSLGTLRQLIAANNETQNDINSMSEQTAHTNESVGKIGQSASLISEIAAQTNLLSLNASIEAARAGEAGKGFAVVAEEIGHLAKQSEETVKEINSIIGELTENSQKSVDLMTKMDSASGNQVKALEDTSKMFEGLKSALDSCVKSVDSISKMIGEVDSQKDKINENIDLLNQIATDNAASTEETSSMANEFEETVEKSEKTVEALSGDVSSLASNMSKFKY